MQAWNLKCCHIKLWRIIKESSVWWVLNIICVLFYCGLYTMAINIVAWRIIKKLCIWSLQLCNFLCLPAFALFLQKLCQLSRSPCVVSGKFNINHYWGYAALPAAPESCLRNTAVTSQWLWACDWLWVFEIRATTSLLPVGRNFALVHY